jgi:hypothetical protein
MHWIAHQEVLVTEDIQKMHLICLQKLEFLFRQRIHISNRIITMAQEFAQQLIKLN